MTTPQQPGVSESETPDEVLTPATEAPETEAPGKPEPSDTPIYDSVASAADTIAPSAEPAVAEPADATEATPPVHEYQVMHRVSAPDGSGAASHYTSAFLLLEDAIDFIRTHVL